MKHNGFICGCLFGFHVIWVTTVCGQTFQLSSSCGGTVQTGGSCTLTCQTSFSAVAWRNGGSTSYTQERGTCSSTSPSLPSGYTSTCPTSNTYTISFTNARYSRDSKTWICGSPFGGGTDSNEIQVDVIVPLTSVSLTRTSSSITCVAVSNPRPSITLYRDGVSMATSPSAIEGSNGWTATLNYQLTGNSRNYVYWCQASNTQTSVNSTFSLPQIAVTSVTLRNISANNQEVGAAEGQSLTLTCVTSASYPTATVTWYKNNVQVTTGVSNSTEVTSGVATLTTSSVTLNPLSKSDLGHQVYCRATNQHTSPAVQSYKARLGVWYGPDQVDITLVANTPAIENTDLTLTCTGTTYPAPTFTWDYSDGTSTGGRPGSVTRSTDRWSQTLTFQPDRNKPTVRCLTRNSQTPATQSATKTLDVKYPPPGSPSITRFTATMFEGDRETITCSVTGGRPLADITWSCPGTGSPAVSSNGQTKTSTLTFTVTKGQNGQQCRCQGSWEYGGYSQSDVMSFDVSYPPDKPTITDPGSLCEGKSTSLTCSSSDPGNPPATYYWTKNTVSMATGSIYAFTPGRDDHQAQIRCEAGNNHTDRSGHSRPQSDERHINVFYIPRITIIPAGTQSRLEGQNLSLTCSATSNPDNAVLSWSFNETSLPGPLLEKTKLNKSDQGEYTCTGRVNTGSACPGGFLEGNNHVQVNIYATPPVPGDLIAWSTSPDTIKLSWKVVVRDGLKQHFVVEYEKDGDTWKKSSESYNETGRNYVQGYVKGLKPETLYFLRVKSVTDFGSSDFTEDVRVLTKRSIQNQEFLSSQESNTGTILISIGITMIVLAIAVAGILIFVSLKLKRTPNSEKQQHYTSFQPRDGNTYDELRSTVYQNTEFNSSE